MENSTASTLTLKQFQVDALSVKVYDSSLKLATDAANFVGDYLLSLLTRQEKVRIILATGNSQLQFLDSLTSSTQIDWSRVVFFHLDEYLGISPEHQSSFRYYLRREVEEKVNAAQFNYIRGDAVEPLTECDRYKQLIERQAIDLCMLGVGKNGHLAFNEPTVANFQDSRTIKLVKLETKTRQQQIDSGYFTGSETVPQYAFTLTIPTICAAKKIICLAGGERKAAIIKTMLQAPISTSVPATVLRRQPQATLFLDRESASLLSMNN